MFTIERKSYLQIPVLSSPVRHSRNCWRTGVQARRGTGLAHRSAVNTVPQHLALTGPKVLSVFQVALYGVFLRACSHYHITSSSHVYANCEPIIEGTVSCPLDQSRHEWDRYTVMTCDSSRHYHRNIRGVIGFLTFVKRQETGVLQHLQYSLPPGIKCGTETAGVEIECSVGTRSIGKVTWNMSYFYTILKITP